MANARVDLNPHQVDAALCRRTLRKQALEYIRFTQEFLPSEKDHELYEQVSAYLQREVLHALPASQRTLKTLISGAPRIVDVRDRGDSSEPHQTSSEAKRRWKARSMRKTRRWPLRAEDGVILPLVVSRMIVSEERNGGH